MKRLFALLIATLLAFTAFAVPALADESTWLTPEKVTFTAFTTIPANKLYTDDLDNNWFTQYLEDETNVHIEWADLTYGASGDDNLTKLNLMLTSGDYPDLILENSFSKQTLYQAGQDGVVIPLNDLIAENAPNLTAIFDDRPDIAAQWIMPDGKIYGLGLITEYFHGEANNRVWLYEPWLDTLGLEMPQTTEEFYNMLVAMRDDDPNGNGEADEIPLLTMNSSTKVWLLCSFEYYDGSNLMLDGDTIKFVSNTDGFHEGVRFFKRLYSEGLVPKDVFTLDDTQKSALIMSDPYRVGCVGVFSFGGLWTDMRTSEDTTAKSMTALPPLEGPTGLRQIPKGTFNFGPDRFSITTACGNPELATAWVDWFYDEAHSMTECYGPYLEEDKQNGEWPGWYEVRDGLYWNVQLDTSSDNYNNNIAWGQNIAPFYAPITDAINQASIDGTFGWAEASYAASSFLFDPWKVSDKRVPNFFMTEDGAQEIAEYKTAIKSLVDQWFAEFVTGVKDVDADWDTYCAELEAMGLQEYLEVYQKEYDTNVLGK